MMLAGILSGLFEILWAVCQKIFAWFGEWVKQLFEMLRGLGDQLLDFVFDRLGTVFPSVNWEPLQDSVDKLNYVFPLSETLVFATTLFMVWALVFAYRTVKSWLPLVSGT